VSHKGCGAWQNCKKRKGRESNLIKTRIEPDGGGAYAKTRRWGGKFGTGIAWQKPRVPDSRICSGLSDFTGKKGRREGEKNKRGTVLKQTFWGVVSSSNDSGGVGGMKFL